jgi:hypothetical protein
MHGVPCMADPTRPEDRVRLREPEYRILQGLSAPLNPECLHSEVHQGLQISKPVVEGPNGW